MSTYVPIQAITLSAAAANVTFTGIPQTFTDLVLVANGRSTGTSGTSEAMNLRINSDSSSLYSVTRLSGTGSSAFSNRGSNATATEVSRLSPSTGSYNAFDATIIQFLNYASTSVNKTILCRGNSMNEDVPVTATVSLYRSTNAVTSVTLFPAVAANFASGSTFTLYGIGSGSPKAFGGDEVRTDGTYWYHIFTSSGRFEPVQALDNVDFLVIAGGGGGGYNQFSAPSAGGGGGGAGGYRCSVTGESSGGGGSAESKLSLVANTSYTVTVGAGGARATAADTPATSGSNSVFSTITSTGGGGGVGGNANGATGGSGGGSGAHNAAKTGGAGTTNQGFKGGDNVGTNPFPSGGGGGAGAAGGNGTGTTSGNGGVGIASSITGTSVTRAGGGGGGNYVNSGTAGTGGSGGGGNGSNAGAGGAGTANTGGGAGNYAAGGSGIVVIRYGV